MNIVWATIEPPYPPNSGGRILVYNRIKALSEAGHRIYLFTFTNEDPDLVRNIDLHDVTVFVYRRRHRLLRALMRPHMPYPSAIRVDTKMLADLKRCITTNFIDIVVVEHATLSPLFVGAQIPKCLVVCTIEHDMLLSIAAQERALVLKIIYGLQGYLMKKVEINNYAKRHFDFYLFVSPQEYEWVIRQFPRLKEISTVVTTGGIQMRPAVTRVHLKAKGRQKWIVFTGKMNYVPNCQGVVWFAREVLPAIKRRVPNAVFYIVGKDPTPDVLQLHNGTDIVVTGAVPSTDEYVDKADLCVLPLVSGTGVGGGLKIKLLDWLVVGKIVVTTSATVQGTPLSDVVLTADDPMTFANRCIEVLSEPTKYRHLSSRAMELVNRFYSTKDTAAILTALFRRIIHNQKK